MKNRVLYVAIFISFLTIFLKGIVLINSQQLSIMNTYSGGFPVAWFELYYPNEVNEPINFIYENFRNEPKIISYKIDLFAFLLNVLVIILIISIMKKLIQYFITKFSHL